MSTTPPLYAPIADRFREAIGSSPGSNTYSRLIRTGKLKAVKILGQWMCTSQDIVDYAQAEADAAKPYHESPAARRGVPSRTETARARAQSAAMAELEREGIA